MSASTQSRNGLLSCRAAVFVGAGKPLELRTLPVPAPGPGEALVRVECCTICGSDLHTLSGSRIEPMPSILGHEILGVIEDVGDPQPVDIDGRPLQPGDRVTWSTAVSCGACDRCRGGLPQKCRSLAKYGHELAEGPYALCGGLAEYIVLRRGSATIRVPRETLAEIICPVNCATATVAAAFRTAGALAEHRVLILGAGMLGLTAAAYAQSGGAAAVALCDVDARRLTRAASFGASAAVEWHVEADEVRRRLANQGVSREFDIVVELSGSPEAVETALALADVGGKVVLVGSVKKSRPVMVDPEQVVRRWLSIHGVHNYVPGDLQAAVAFLERYGQVYPFAELVEFTYPLAEVNAAVERARESRPLRVAIRP